MTVLALESATRFGTEGGVIRGLESYVAEEPPGAAATLVQHNIYTWWYETTQASVTFDANLTPGTTLVAISQIANTGITGPVTDTGGHTWTQQAIVNVFSGAGSNDFSASVCTAPNTSSGSCTVTVPWSGAGSTNVPKYIIFVAEIANGDFHDVVLQHCRSFTTYTLPATDSMVGEGGIALGWASQVDGNITDMLAPPVVEHFVPTNTDYQREAYFGLAELGDGETLATEFTVDNGYWSFVGATVAFKATSTEFSPADITGLACWYDPSDAATITLSGADITGVANKAGADFDLTTAGTVAQGTQYGLDTFDFGFATGNFEYNGGNTVIAGPQCTAVQVFKRTGGSGPRGLGMFAASGDDWNTAGGAAILSTDPSYPGCYRNSGQKSYANPAATWNEWHVVMSIFDGTNHTMYLDGVAATPAASTDTFATVRLRVGAGSYSDRWVGEMGDVLLYEHALDATERTDLLTYLQAKWIPPVVVPVVQGTPATTVNSTTINKPTGAVVGEKLVAVVLTYGNVDPGPPTLSGFTQRLETFSGRNQITVFDRVVDGSEASTFTLSGPTNFPNTVMFRLSDAGDFGADFGTAPSSPTVDAVRNLEEVTVDTDNSLAFGVASGYQSAYSMTTPPSGWTQIANWDVEQYLYTREVASAATIPDTSYTASGAGYWGSLTFFYEAM